MIAVLQRAAHAAVRVEGEVVGEISRGLLILLGVGLWWLEYHLAKRGGKEEAEDDQS